MPENRGAVAARNAASVMLGRKSTGFSWHDLQRWSEFDNESERARAQVGALKEALASEAKRKRRCCRAPDER